MKHKDRPDLQRSARIVADVNGRIRNQFKERFVDAENGRTWNLYLEGFLAYMLTLSEDEAINLRGKLVRSLTSTMSQYNIEFNTDLYKMPEAEMVKKYDFDPHSNYQPIDPSKGPIEV